ncbi:MAG: hypothetical protein E6R03_15510 [Hyphomicrobiaceae bacterium]|nr:MAG: hypothetical protein E6R03_15510 [Hyphomicrobiaceae bacterium]
MNDVTQGATDAGQTAGGTEPSPAEVMAFDPFGPAQDTPAAEAGAQTTPSTEGTGVESGKTEKTTEPAQQELSLDKADPNVTNTQPVTQPAGQTSALEELVRTQTAQINQLIAERQAANPTQGQQEQTPPRFNLAIPPQVVGMLRSEDDAEFAQGMHAVINGIANKIWTDMETHVGELMQSRVPQIVQGHSEAVQTRQRIADDFYGKYPSLKHPTLQTIVQQAGVQVAQARAQRGGNLGWDESLRDEIAEAVFQLLPQLRQTAPAQTQTPAAAPQRVPQFATGTGSRPATQSDPTQEFRDLLN